MALENITLSYNETDHQITDANNVAIAPNAGSSVSFSEDDETWVAASEYDYLEVEIANNMALISTTDDTINLFVDDEDDSETKTVYIKIEDSYTSTLYTGTVTITEQ